MEQQTFSTTCLEDGTVIISSGQRLSIENAADFAKALSAALSGAQREGIDCDAQVEADITALQVLCAACKTAAAGGKALALPEQGVDSDSLRQLIMAVGADHLGTCRHNNNNSCIWLGGNRA